MARIFLLIILLLWLVFGSLSSTLAQQPETGVQWSRGMRISPLEESNSRLADLAVDGQGRVHVVWDEIIDEDHQPTSEEIGIGLATSQEESVVFYSVWDGQQWSQANDIVPLRQDAIRSAIAVDNYDLLHLLFGHDPSLSLYYKQAPASQGFSAVGWTPPRLVNNKFGTHTGDITVYQDTIHIVYDDGEVPQVGECRGCVHIFYRYSPDRGLTWSTPVALFPASETSSVARPQVKVDRTGTIHVTWDETGWDFLHNQKQYGVYMYSTDGGSSWSTPTIVSYYNLPSTQLAVGSNDQGGVMLVWRTTLPEYRGIYYMWSVDNGQSWMPPQTLPNIVAREWNARLFDMYDMATDSAGHIHLLAIGYTSANQELPGLYHLEWNGNTWSHPTPVYEASWAPEYPRLVIHGGNQLHATWFIRGNVQATVESDQVQRTVEPDQTQENVETNQVWYAYGQALAPAETPVIRPTFTPPPSPLTPTPTPAPTPTPTLSDSVTRLSVPEGSAESIYTEIDDLLLLAKSLLPVALLIVVIIMGIRHWPR